MADIIRDPMWQFVGIVIGAFIAITIYLLQRQKKKLSYLISRTQLLTVREELEGKLQVLYEGQPASDIQMLVVQIRNSGNVPIVATDYEHPVSVMTGTTSKILSAVVTDVSPKDLTAEISTTATSVTIFPLLLNSGDSIKLKILVSDSDAGIKVSGRVVGVKQIQNDVDAGFPRFRLYVGTICTLLGMYLVVHESSPPVSTPFSFIQDGVIQGMALLVLGYGLVFSVTLKRRIFSKVFRALTQN